MESKFDLVIPIIERDMQVFERIIEYLWKYLPIKRIVLIGDERVNERLKCNNLKNIDFINENNIIPFDIIHDCMVKISENNVKAVQRTGWYYQQFIKMAYSLHCNEDYYLLWDGDTVPLHKIEMFDGDKPYFDMKTEFYPYYFETLNNLLGLDKVSKGSFISEHMIISVEIMRNLIEEIENRSVIQGNTFYEKILYSIKKEHLHFSGFSEFETYGTYVQYRFPDRYECREWKSLREGSKYFDINNFNAADSAWLSKQYDAISFEKNMNKIPEYKLYSLKIFRLFLKFDDLNKLNIKIRRVLHNIKYAKQK